MTGKKWILVEGLMLVFPRCRAEDNIKTGRESTGYSTGFSRAMLSSAMNLLIP
jgi:hypothetical protein